MIAWMIFSDNDKEILKYMKIQLNKWSDIDIETNRILLLNEKYDIILNNYDDNDSFTRIEIKLHNEVLSEKFEQNLKNQIQNIEEETKNLKIEGKQLKKENANNKKIQEIKNRFERPAQGKQYVKVTRGCRRERGASNNQQAEYAPIKGASQKRRQK